MQNCSSLGNSLINPKYGMKAEKMLFFPVYAFEKKTRFATKKNRQTPVPS
jgi:hypothetical protein